MLTAVNPNIIAQDSFQSENVMMWDISFFQLAFTLGDGVSPHLTIVICNCCVECDFASIMRPIG